MGPQSTDENGTIPPGSSRLAVSRSEAYAKLSKQIRQGQAILALPFDRPSELDAARQQLQLWDKYNVELTNYLFHDPDLHEAYLKSGGIFLALGGNFLMECQRFLQKTQKLTYRESLEDRV